MKNRSMFYHLAVLFITYLFLAPFIVCGISHAQIDECVYTPGYWKNHPEAWPTDVLEIGFGPGTAIKEILKLTTNGHISGIDISNLMVDQATSLNQKAVTEDRLDLRLGDVLQLWDRPPSSCMLLMNLLRL